MKAIFFGSTVLGTVYAALRVEWIQYIGISLFVGGSFFVLTYSLYRHLRANRFHL
jgi:hypothetical protein